MAEDFNKNHAASIKYVNDAIVDAYEKLQQWMTENVDKLHYVNQISEILKEAYRDDNIGTALDYANAIKSAVDDIVTAIQDSGGVVGNANLGDFATIISQIATFNHKICYIGKTENLYSLTEYNEYVAAHGEAPENNELGIAVFTPYQSFIMASSVTLAGGVYPTLQWGIQDSIIPNLYSAQSGTLMNVLKNDLNFNSTENTKQILLWYNPEALPHTDFDNTDPDKDYTSYNCVRFATKAELLSSNLQLDNASQVYIVTLDESDNDTANNCYYWDTINNVYVKRFPVPKVANTVSEFAWKSNLGDGDTHQFTLPTINHCLTIASYSNEINMYLNNMGGSALIGYAWNCGLINDVRYAYKTDILTGYNVNESRGVRCYCIPVCNINPYPILTHSTH